MTSVYTQLVLDGATFPEFAMACARQFSALVEMRGDPLGAEVPQKFAVADYYAEAVGDALAALAELRGLSPEEAELKAVREYDAEVVSRKAGQATEAANRVRYEAMLRQASAWALPTSEHAGLKSLMVCQLREALEWGCSGGYVEPARLSGAEWLTEKLAWAWKSVARAKAALAEEAELVRSRNEWVASLRASLAGAGS